METDRQLRSSQDGSERAVEGSGDRQEQVFPGAETQKHLCSAGPLGDLLCITPFKRQNTPEHEHLDARVVAGQSPCQPASLMTNGMP